MNFFYYIDFRLIKILLPQRFAGFLPARERGSAGKITFPSRFFYAKPPATEVRLPVAEEKCPAVACSHFFPGIIFF